MERAAFAELLEAAELGDVEVRVLDLALLVQVDRDLGVAFDAGDGIDDDGLPCFTISYMLYTSHLISNFRDSRLALTHARSPSQTHIRHAPFQQFAQHVDK